MATSQSLNEAGHGFHASEAEFEQFQELGFFLREEVLGAEELAVLREGVDQAHQKILDVCTIPNQF